MHQLLISQHLFKKLTKTTIMEIEIMFKLKSQKFHSINHKLLIQEILFNYILNLDHKLLLAKDKIMSAQKMKLNQFHYKQDQLFKF